MLPPIKYNLKNINPKIFGWVRPDNAISFQSPNLAKSYAKNRVLQALSGEAPFERGILLKDNVVYKEFNGTKYNIKNIELPFSVSTNAIFYHGHPVTSPLSIEDFLSQIAAKFKEIRAYSPNGEYSSLKRIAKNPPKNDNQIGSAVALDYFKQKSDSFFPIELQRTAEAGYHVLNPMKQFSDDSLVKSFWTLVENKSPLLLKLADAMSEMLKISKAELKFNNDFFKNNAQKYGFKYTQNLTSFVDEK